MPSTHLTLIQQANQISENVAKFWETKKRAYDATADCLDLRYQNISVDTALELTKLWIKHPAKNLDVALMLSDWHTGTDDDGLRPWAQKYLNLDSSDRAKRLELFGAVAIRSANREARQANLVYQRNLLNKQKINIHRAISTHFNDQSYEIDPFQYRALMIEELAAVENKVRERTLQKPFDEDKPTAAQKQYLALVKYAVNAQLTQHFADDDNYVIVERILRNLFVMEDEKENIDIAWKFMLNTVHTALPKAKFNVFEQLKLLLGAVEPEPRWNTIQHMQRQAIVDLCEEALAYFQAKPTQLSAAQRESFSYFRYFSPRSMVEEIKITKDMVKSERLVLAYNAITGDQSLSRTTSYRHRNHITLTPQARQNAQMKIYGQDGKLIFAMLNPKNSLSRKTMLRLANEYRQSLSNRNPNQKLTRDQKGSQKVQQVFISFVDRDDRTGSSITSLSRQHHWNKEFIYRRLYAYWYHLFQGFSRQNNQNYPNQELLIQDVADQKTFIDYGLMTKVVNQKGFYIPTKNKK